MKTSFENYLRSEGLRPRTVQCYLRVANRMGNDPAEWLRAELRDVPLGTACVYKSAVNRWMDWQGRERPEVPRGKRKRRKARLPLTDTELRRWYSRLKSQPDPARTVLEILPRTGMRVSELCGARRRQLLQQGDNWGIVVDGKGGHQRWVPLSSAAVRCLEGYLRCSIEQFAEDELEDVIFVGKSGAPISANWVREVARKVARDIDVECSPHVLRHTWATRAHRAGVSPTDIQAVLGHVSANTTAIYIHADADSMAEAVELADALE